MKSTAEILRNMRVLKLQGWEMNFLAKILHIRSVETGWLKKYLFSGALMGFAYGIAPTFVAFATFGTCILAGIPLESGKILSAIATFRVLQNPIYQLPETISSLVQFKVSLDRISSVLSLDEVQDQVVETLPTGSSDNAVEIVGGNFSWDLSSSSSATLKDINLKVPHGKKVAICGTVGSGKTTLLSCILGEVPKISGEIRLYGTKAYVAQSPWIQSGTIEDNILFGKDMDRQKYNNVIEACCLIKDLEALSFGDQTVIGERGINLSGGQKQRIQIARALYQEADIYLFDDPFSAVDAHTGSHLFKEVLMGCLGSKTVVYVTHQVEFLQDADIILVLKDGKIMQAGMYDDILKPGSDFLELVGAQKTALSILDSKMAEPVSEDEFHTSGVMQQVENKEASQNFGENMKDGPQEEQLIKEEEREKGSVGFSVYWKYLTTAYGGVLVPFLLLAGILVETLRIGSNYWLAWATPVSEDAKSIVSESTLVVIYVSLVVGVSIFTLLGDTLTAILGFKTATKLFNQMHVSIFRAPMSFFDATPSGRILNRCSTDQSVVETQIPYLVQGFASYIFEILGVVGVISSVEWRVLIIFIPVILICIWYQQYYICSARDLSRLNGVCEAPVIQHLSETISGTTTIRGFDQQLRFQETYMNILNAYSRPAFHKAAALKWLMLRIQMFSSTTIALLLVLVVSFPQGTDPAIAGLAVTYGLTLSSSVIGIINFLCHCETAMISVERIFQYTSIPSEGPLEVEANRPDCSWPSYGEVIVDNLQVRYAPHMPLVLHGLTCTFQGGSKTGIVGRTGSGKSTLIQALFRIVEPANGQIRIDGTNISSIGLKDLRTKLSIIPQDPTMFEGTIRSNLDPLQMYTDEQIWEALDKCQLGDEVRRMERQLDSNVTENGENWSMGQRQLVCLGRVILKKSKVVVLDEATASVDTATDNQIQQTLKMHFAHCTLITIAHRITSVLDSDTVLLLSHGHLKEHDSPRRLLENKSSLFSKLVAEYTTRSKSGLIN